MADGQPRTPVIRADGAPLDDDLFGLLAALTVDQRMDRSGVTTLRFADPGYGWLDRDPKVFQVGAKVEVMVPDGNQTLESVFDGIVAAVGVEQAEDRGTPHVVVEARERAFLLTRHGEIGSFREMSRKQIVESIAADHGFKAQVGRDDSDFDYLLRAGTDAEMLDSLAEPIGYHWWIEGQTLHFEPRASTAGPTLDADEDLLRFSTRYAGTETPQSVEVLGWDVTTQAGFSSTVKVHAQGEPQDLGSDASFATEQHDRARQHLNGSIQISTDGALDADEADAIGDAYARRLTRLALRAEGLALATPQVRTNEFVTIEGVGARLGGRYFVTRVVHEFLPGKDTRTRFFCDPGERSASDRSQSAAPSTSPVTGPLDGFGRHHLVIGQVTNVKDPQDLGRVKVKFPSLGSEDESAWARLVLPGAGDERGFDVRPEVDDEVLVAFERGDRRVPLVLGGLHSSKRKPAPANQTDGRVITERVLTTRVGHKVTLSDGAADAAKGDAARHIRIDLADGSTSLYLGEDKVTLEATSGNEIEFKTGGTSLKLTDRDGVTIDAPNLKVKAKQDVALEGGSKVQIKGMNLGIDASAQLEVKGGMVKVQSKGIAEVKGQMVKIN